MTRRDITLREWQTLSPEPGSVLSGLNFDDCLEARTIASALTERGRLEVLEMARGVELRASSFVGRVQLGNLTITIQPKLRGSALIHLLRYAYGLRDLDLHAATGFDTSLGAFQDLLVQQLAAEVSELLTRGLHRHYLRSEDDLAQPRGRLDFSRWVRQQHRPVATLPCVHHPRSMDNVLNQAVLAGLIHASGITTDLELKAQLRRLVKQISEHVSRRDLSLAMLGQAQLLIDRRTTSYSSALVLIRLLYAGEGITLDGTSSLRLPGFMFDMNSFFQALISRFLHDHLEGYEVLDEHRMKEFFRYDPLRNPQCRRAVVQRPDFVVRRKQEPVAIMDAKYRDLWETSLPREMLYQLSLYALAFKGPCKRAVILYPTLQSKATDQAVIIHEPLSSRPQAEVILRPVNLLALERQLRDRSLAGREARVASASFWAFGTHTKKQTTVRQPSHADQIH